MKLLTHAIQCDNIDAQCRDIGTQCGDASARRALHGNTGFLRCDTRILTLGVAISAPGTELL